MGHLDKNIRSQDLSEEASKEELLRYDGIVLDDPPETFGLLCVLEPPVKKAFPAPDLVVDLSGKDILFAVDAEQHIHGSYLVRRNDALLFGPNHLVVPEGFWSCEARTYKGQFLEYFEFPFYNKMFPGVRPTLEHQGAQTRIGTISLAESGGAFHIDAPVFLATPVEPPIWGRWVSTVLPKVIQYLQHMPNRMFFCYVEMEWQKRFLKFLGVSDSMILPHDPGKTYICRDIATVEYSITNMTVSAWERTNYIEIAARCWHFEKWPERIFVSRRSRSIANPNYRVLVNEQQLADMLHTLGFVTIEPELLPYDVQISLFAAAREIVFVGGSAVFNAVFCSPGTSVMTIKSSTAYIATHAGLFASLNLRYGIIFGEEDTDDPASYHKRWHLDINRTRDAVMQFFG